MNNKNVGVVGLGSKVKIINQLLAGVHIAASAEAMALGLREGVDADAHQMFMQASSAGFGREDDSAVIKIFPGIELPTAKPESA